MTSNGFLEALFAARPGERVEYHRGNLAAACHAEEQSAIKHKRTLCELRATAWDMHLRGKCALVQKRVGPDACTYLAERI